MKRFHLNLEETPWHKSARFPALPVDGDIHIWRLKVTEDKARLNKAKQLLNTAERTKAERFHFARDRNCSLLSRAALRTLAGKYLKVAPQTIKIELEKNGKPRLAEPQNNLSCNLSHAAGWIVLAFGAGSDLGVDIEGVNPEIEVENIADTFFSRLEVPVILGQPPERRAEAFFYAWTRKEALIKATGEGLSLPLNKFGVSILPQRELKVLHTDWAPREAEDWQLLSFTTVPNLPGAVARRGAIEEVRFFDF